MKKVLLFALYAASVLVAGCETTPQQATAAADRSEGEVITGSRIPRKGGSSDAVSTQGAGDYKRDKN